MPKIGYVRVSREKQDPESQIKLLRDMGIPDQDIFVDHGISGWVDPLARPIYKTMMKRVDDKTREPVTEIIFSEFSRLGRNAMDGLAELVRLERKSITIKSLSNTESFINDVPAPWQGFILHGMMLGAELERKHHKERTVWGLENARSNGRRGGRPTIKIDFKKIKATQDQYGISENVARKILGYNQSTFYKRKKELRCGGENDE